MTVRALWRGLVLSIAGIGAAASAQMRVVNYNIAQLNGDGTALQNVLAALNVDGKPGFATAPWVYVFQEVQNEAVNPDWQVLLNRLNAVAPPGVTYVRATFTSIGSESGSGGAQACYYRTDKLVEDAFAHADIYTGAGRYTDRWRLRLVGYSSPQVYFYIYSAHLKSGTSGADATERQTGASAIRANADSLGAGTHILYAGDFNLYNNAEPAYAAFTAAGTGQAIDPQGSSNWTGVSNAIRHTQSPHAGGSLVTGGMDDRFDFQLITSAFNDGEGLSIVPGTYRAFGNDGNHYNLAINVGTNTYYLPNADVLADNLALASDHLPLVVEYQIPAILSATLEPTEFGRVIQGASVSVEVQVGNVAEGLIPAGVDELDFNAIGSGALSGTQSGSVPGLGAPVSRTFAVDTSIPGPCAGSVQFLSTSQGAQGSNTVRTTSGLVLRPARPSFSALEEQPAAIVAIEVSPDSGSHLLTAYIHNLAFDANQALLDIDAVSPVSAPFAFLGGIQRDIGAAPATLTFSFDSTGRPAGTYDQMITIDVSDEDVPGAASATLDLTLEVQVRRRLGDVNCDGVVNFDDIDPFVLALVGRSGYEAVFPECDFDLADANSDGVVNFDDIDPFVALLIGG